MIMFKLFSFLYLIFTLNADDNFRNRNLFVLIQSKRIMLYNTPGYLGILYKLWRVINIILF